MGLFVRNNAIAITWTPQSCHAVHLRVSGATCTVTAAWNGEVGKAGASLAELLVRAAKEVGCDDSVYLIAGGNGQGWGMADVTVPATLKNDELRSALAFELRKQTPLPIDRITWGYRIIPNQPGQAANGTRRARLIYVKSENWASWQKAIDGLGHVDALLPAPAALDPLLAEQSLTMPGGPGTPGRYEYRWTAEGRQIIPQSEEQPLDFSQAMPLKDVDLGPIKSLSNAEQLPYIPAVTLALYGLTDCVSSDSKTLPQLPERFAARRNIAAKVCAGALAIYIVGLLIYMLASSFQMHSAQLRKIDLAIKETKKELNAINKLLDPKDNERANLLRQEMQDYTPNAPDFPTALLEITRTVNPNAWISQSFEWKAGNITFQIQGPVKDLDLATRLEDSPYLGDVTEKISSYNQSSSSYTQRFELAARFDTPQEAEALQIKQERAKEQAAKEAAAAAAAQAAAKADEDAEDDGALEDDEE